MNIKKIIGLVLLAFVIASLVYAVIKESNKGAASGPAPAPGVSREVQSPPSPLSGETVAAKDHRIIAYYFHTTARCPTCYRIESYTQEAIASNFGAALKDRTLEWRVINVETPGNEHFVKEYSLYTKSVILAEVKSGQVVKWKNLDQIWGLTGNQEGFINYVRGETDAFLAGIKG